MTTLLAISPHLDDAVFSAGAMLWKAAQSGDRVIIATVFTGNVARPTGFALACQLDKGLGPEVDYMALRRDEDRDACALLGAEARHLPLLEAPHRGYRDAAALFGAVRPDDAAGAEVRSALTSLIGEIAPDRLLGPLGIGGHVDHLIVRDALAEVAGPVPLSWWEDWPYLDRSGAVDREGTRCTSLSEESRTAKLRACSAYHSQLGFQFGGRDKLRLALKRQEAEYLHENRPHARLS